MEFVQLIRIENAVLVRVTKLEYPLQSSHASGFQNLFDVMRRLPKQKEHIRDLVNHKGAPWDVRRLFVQSRKLPTHSCSFLLNIPHMFLLPRSTSI